MADTTKTLKDAAYVLIGLGVIGFQRAQVRRLDLSKRLEQQRQQLEAQASTARATALSQLEAAGSQLTQAGSQLAKLARDTIGRAA